MALREVINYFDYTLLINLENITIEVYNPVCREFTSGDLPFGISWAVVKEFLDPDPNKPEFLWKVYGMTKETLIERIKDFYFRGKT